MVRNAHAAAAAAAAAIIAVVSTDDHDDADDVKCHIFGGSPLSLLSYCLSFSFSLSTIFTYSCSNSLHLVVFSPTFLSFSLLPVHERKASVTLN